MQVILLTDDKNLGSLGAVINVKAGYARNYLIPQHKAKFATKANLELFEKEKEGLILKANEALLAAQEQEQQMSDIIIDMNQNASDEGKLFGSISPQDIAKSLTDLGHNIQKRDIQMPDGLIRNVGEYTVVVSLHNDININIKVVVSAK